MNKTRVLLVLIGIVFLVWALGILTRLWANPIFSYFWVASNNMADNLSYVGLGVGAFLVGLALIVYRRNTRNRTATSYKLYPHKQLKAKSYDEFLLKKTSTPIESDDGSNQFVIVNGRQSYLGSEVMEKIVDQ